MVLLTVEHWCRIVHGCYILHAGWYLTMVDNMFLAIYIVEFLLKFYAWRLRYFKLGWNIFDIQLSAVHSLNDNTMQLYNTYTCTIMATLLHMLHDVPWLQSRLCDHNCKFCGLSSSTDCPECCWHFWHKGLWSANCVQVLSCSEGTQSTADHQVRVTLNLNSFHGIVLMWKSAIYIATMCVHAPHSLTHHSLIHRFLKNLQIIVTTVLRSIPALGNIVLLISLVLCILWTCSALLHDKHYKHSHSRRRLWKTSTCCAFPDSRARNQTCLPSLDGVCMQR